MQNQALALPANPQFRGDQAENADTDEEDVEEEPSDGDSVEELSDEDASQSTSPQHPYTGGKGLPPPPPQARPTVGRKGPPAPHPYAGGKGLPPHPHPQARPTVGRKGPPAPHPYAGGKGLPPQPAHPFTGGKGPMAGWNEGEDESAARDSQSLAGEISTSEEEEDEEEGRAASAPRRKRGRSPSPLADGGRRRPSRRGESGSKHHRHRHGHRRSSHVRSEKKGGPERARRPSHTHKHREEQSESESSSSYSCSSSSSAASDLSSEDDESRPKCDGASLGVSKKRRTRRRARDARDENDVGIGSSSGRRRRATEDASRQSLQQVVERDKLCTHAHPIVTLLRQKTKPRPCGKCVGCQGCGTCTNCRKNIDANAEFDRLNKEFMAKHPELFATAAQQQQQEEAASAEAPSTATRAKRPAKIPGRPQRKKRLICQNLQCDRLRGTPWENTAAVAMSRADWDQLNKRLRTARLALVELETKLERAADGGPERAELEARISQTQAEISRIDAVHRTSKRGKSMFQTGFSFISCPIFKLEKLRSRHSGEIVQHNSDTDPKMTQDIRRRVRDQIGKVITDFVVHFKDVVDVPQIHTELERALREAEPFGGPPERAPQEQSPPPPQPRL